MSKQEDGLDPARGCLIGIVSSLPLWALIIWAIIHWWRT